MDISRLTICGATEGMRTRAFSSVELTRAVLDAIARRDGDLNAYLSVDGESALRQAEAADIARAEGHEGALLGVPVLLLVYLTDKKIYRNQR